MKNWSRTWEQLRRGRTNGKWFLALTITKQAIEVIFSCKDRRNEHPDLTFNGIPIASKPFTKHLGVFLDSRLNFSKHIKEKVAKAMKGVSLLKFFV